VLPCLSACECGDERKGMCDVLTKGVCMLRAVYVVGVLLRLALHRPFLFKRESPWMFGLVALPLVAASK
jgi:hypothetical protein